MKKEIYQKVCRCSFDTSSKTLANRKPTGQRNVLLNEDALYRRRNDAQSLKYFEVHSVVQRFFLCCSSMLLYVHLWSSMLIYGPLCSSTSNDACVSVLSIHLKLESSHLD